MTHMLFAVSHPIGLASEGPCVLLNVSYKTTFRSSTNCTPSAASSLDEPKNLQSEPGNVTSDVVAVRACETVSIESALSSLIVYWCTDWHVVIKVSRSSASVTSADDPTM